MKLSRNPIGSLLGIDITCECGLVWDMCKQTKFVKFLRADNGTGSKFRALVSAAAVALAKFNFMAAE